MNTTVYLYNINIKGSVAGERVNAAVIRLKRKNVLCVENTEGLSVTALLLLCCYVGGRGYAGIDTHMAGLVKSQIKFRLYY